MYKRRQGLLYIRGKSPGSNVVNSLLLFGDKIEKKPIVDPDLNQIPLRIFKMSGSNGYVIVWSSRVSLIIIFSEKALLRIYSLPVCLLTEGTFDYHATNYSIKSNNSFGSKGQIIRCTRFGRRLILTQKNF